MSTPLAEVTNHDVLETLDACLAACMDGMKGYATAASDTHDTGLKSIFEKYAAQRAEFVRILRESIRGYGEHPKDHGTAKGTAHRGFIEARATLEPKNADTMILGECERGELAALATYDHAFDKTPLDALPTGLRAILVEQRAAIQVAHDALANRDLDRRGFHH
jgi:uncharacterized protein (TIGR02284 family)